MLAIALCVIAYGVCFKATRRALWLGFAATMAFGYAYGILRANIEQAASHFIYDGAAVGLYAALLSQHLRPAQKFKLRPLMPWVICFVGWPALLFLVPVQDPLVQLVGLRGAIFFVPFMLVGALLEPDDLKRIAKCMALLNTAALAFAVAEVVLGVERFYPKNAVDQLIYLSGDVNYGGVSHFRIPAIFTGSAAYAGNMLASFPLLIGALSLERRDARWRWLLLGALGVSAIGIFLAASRTAAVVLILIAGMVTLTGRVKNIPWTAWLALIVAVGLLVSATPRMQRFFTLKDTDFVKTRIGGSVNENFLEVVRDYPLGNGLGGGGTSMPYFLQNRVGNPVLIENEYGRILAEEGIPGLMIWVGFIFWLFTRPIPRRSDPWYTAKWLARLFCGISFAIAPLGTGTLTSIPETSMLMLFAGWIASPKLAPARSRIPRQGTASTALQGA